MNIHTVAIGLGSNIEPREYYLNSAMDVISKEIGLIEKKSSVFETAAWGNTNQSDFLNQVVLVSTHKKPEDLIINLQQIEHQFHRTRWEHWGPRTIDLDILYFGDEVFESSSLKIPHVRLHERKFVLLPLLEVSPDWIHPVIHKKITELVECCTDSGMVKKIV
jgi:2-amino-4-hydroxy-6-hydroxymethyldihydropteridine diphosphokinase